MTSRIARRLRLLLTSLAVLGGAYAAARIDVAMRGPCASQETSGVRPPMCTAPQPRLVLAVLGGLFLGAMGWLLVTKLAWLRATRGHNPARGRQRG